MRLQIDRYDIDIIPETQQDIVYIEEVLGLKDEGQRCTAKRVNAMGLRCLAYVRLERTQEAQP